MTETALEVFTIYRRPLDFPDVPFVVRRFVITPAGVRSTDDVFGLTDLDAGRAGLAELGLVCVPRQEGDEPQIVETWL